MDPVLPSIDASKPLGLAGLLSSLGSFIGGNSATTQVFAQFLDQNQNTLPLPPLPAAPVTSSQSEDSPDDADNLPANSPLSTTLKNLISGLHQILRQLGGKPAQNKANTDTAQSGDQAGNQTPSPQSAVASASQNPTANGTISTGNGNSPPDDSGNTNSNDSGNITDPQMLVRILSEIVTLMQMIEKKLEMAQSATGIDVNPSPASDLSQAPVSQDNSWLANLLAQLNGTSGGDATDNTSSGSSTNLPISAADPLTQLLALIEAVEQKLALSSPLQGVGSSTIAGSTASTSLLASNSLPPPLVDFSQIHKDIKEFLNSLQQAAANNNPQNNPALTDGSADTVSDDLPSTIVSTPKLADPAPTGNLSQGPIGNLLSLFENKVNGIFGTPPSANGFVPVNVGLAAEGQNDSAFDTNTQNSGSFSDGDASSANAAVDNTTLMTLADGTKTIDPYSFASQLSASRALNGGATGLPSAVDQVLLLLNRGVKNGDDQMTIQLQPADLGKINIKLDISGDGKVQGSVVADNPATLNLLLKDVRGLERALQEAGLRADPGSLQFSLGGQSGNTSGQTPNNFADNTSSDNTTSSGTVDTSLDVSTDTGEAWILTPGRVNFKV